MAGELTAAGFDLFERARKRSIYRRGDSIFTQDKKARGLYCVQSGYVLLRRVDAFGNETAFRLIGPGELMGYRSFFADEPHASTAQALTRTHVCFHPKTVVDRLVADSGQLAGRFLRVLARDPGPADALLLRGSKLPLRIRFMFMLLLLKERTNSVGVDGNMNFQLPLTRQDMAALLGARPESITRVIRELEEDGIAIFHGREVTVPDAENLAALVKSDGAFRSLRAAGE